MGEHLSKESPVRIIWEHYTTINPEKHDFFKEEGLSSLLGGEWAVVESQRGVRQDEVKTVCQDPTCWKTGIFLRGRIELFNRGWVSCYWFPKWGDAGNEKNDCKTDEENRKGKWKSICLCRVLLCKGCSLPFFYQNKCHKKKKERKKEWKKANKESDTWMDWYF